MDLLPSCGPKAKVQTGTDRHAMAGIAICTDTVTLTASGTATAR